MTATLVEPAAESPQPTGVEAVEPAALPVVPPATLTPPITPQRTRASAAVRTYRYLRFSLVGLVLVLLGCVWLARRTPEFAELGSISAYYYSPARSIFVGALVSIGISLVAVVGRRGFEDSALNLAGMLAPVVAFVPTPRGPGGAPCDPYARCSVPPEFVPSVVNNVWGLLGLGLLGLGFGAWTVVSRRQSSRSTRIGLGVAAFLYGCFLAWFTVGRDSFLDSAHFGAAIPLFALITGVAYVNARKAAARREGVPSKEAKSYTAIYGVVAVVMALTMALAVIFAVMDQTGRQTPAEWVLWVEVVLLSAFAVFWVAQTLDFWNDGVPEEAAEAPVTGG